MKTKGWKGFYDLLIRYNGNLGLAKTSELADAALGARGNPQAARRKAMRVYEERCKVEKSLQRGWVK